MAANMARVSVLGSTHQVCVCSNVSVSLNVDITLSLQELLILNFFFLNMKMGRVFTTIDPPLGVSCRWTFFLRDSEVSSRRSAPVCAILRGRQQQKCVQCEFSIIEQPAVRCGAT